MDCDGLRALLSSKTLAELSVQERAAVDEHFGTCAGCREAWDTAGQSQELSDALQVAGGVDGVRKAVLAQIQAADAPPPGPKPSQAPRARKRLGGFEIVGRLGKGGMGTVLKARQVSMDRIVALKVLPRRLAQNEDYVKRFIREARSAARLRHANIVQAHDVGAVDGYYYFAMEFVDGETLDTVLRRDGPLESRRALQVMKQVCSALRAAHEAGIVHRDIKPSNIMLDRRGEVRVTDFGLAKRTEGDVTITADGHALGTPTYLAPEMASGKPVDARADLYSLGATFFHVLSGRPPFQGSSFSELVVKHVNEPPPPLASVASSVDRRLCRVVDRLLRKNPAARHPSAQAVLDVLDALGPFQDTSSTHMQRRQGPVSELSTATLDPGEHPGTQVPRRKRKGLLAWTSVGAGALLAVGVVAWLLIPEGRQPSVVKPSPRATSAHPLERQAHELLDKAREAAARGDAERAKAYLGRLETQCSETDLYRANGPAIADVRARLKHIIPFATPTTKAPTTYATPVKVPATDVTPEPKGPDPAEWAKWVAIRDEARTLREAGKLDEAAKMLAEAHDLRIDGIQTLVTAEEEALQAAREQAVEKAIAAYEKESDKVWGLFKERKYDEADKLLTDLAANPDFEPVTKQLEADREAVRLLKDFWAAVERGLSQVAGRGSITSVGGVVGKVIKVENGVVTMQAPKGSVERPVRQLGATQAVGFANLDDDERSRLMHGVFLLAEGVDPKEAQKALIAAGDAPHVSAYGDRLAALTLDARELAARRAWQQIERRAAGKLTHVRAQNLLAALEQFQEHYANTGAHREALRELADLRARALSVAGGWVSLFDGKSLKGWRLATGQLYSGHGRAVASDGQITLNRGNPMTGIVWSGEFPQTDFELAAEARALAGKGVCGIVFPVGDTHSRLIVGGGLGDMVALIRVNGRPSTGNPSTRRFECERGHWYDIRIRVTGASVAAWVGGQQVVDLDPRRYRLGLADDSASVTPVALMTTRYSTTAFRNVRFRRLKAAPARPDGLVKSTVRDAEGNLQGDKSRGYMDILEATAARRGDTYKLAAVVAKPFPEAGEMAGKRIDFIWCIDSDRRTDTGQTRKGNDYNIHVYLCEKGWRTHFVKVSEVAKAHPGRVAKGAATVDVGGNAVALSFPASFLPSDCFAWWVECTNGNEPVRDQITRNRPTRRAEFGAAAVSRHPASRPGPR